MYGQEKMLPLMIIEYLVQSSKVRMGMLLRHFKTREPEPMTTMFNSYVRSTLEYCSLVWNPWKKEAIDKLERVQKNFMSNIEHLEKLNCLPPKAEEIKNV